MANALKNLKAELTALDAKAQAHIKGGTDTTPPPKRAVVTNDPTGF